MVLIGELTIAMAYQYLVVTNGFSGSFDGTDDYIEVGNITNLNSGTNFTISVWFTRPSAGEDIKLLGGAGPVATGIGMYPWSDGSDGQLLCSLRCEYFKCNFAWRESMDKCDRDL